MADPPPKQPSVQNKPQSAPPASSPRSPVPRTGEATPVPVPLPTLQFGAPETLPAPKEAKDHTTVVTGNRAGSSTTKRDQVTDLTAEQRYTLLERNNIRLIQKPTREKQDLGPGKMPAYRLETDLSPVKDAVHFETFSLQTARIARVDRSSLSYNEFEWNLQRQSVTQSKTEFGIPGLFNVGATYRDSSAMSSYNRKVTAHFQASQFLPKANIILRESDISLSGEFVQKVKDALAAKSNRDKATVLLKILKDYGHFVPLDVILGGRISLVTATEINDRSEYEAVKTELTVAASAKFKAGGVPYEASNATGNQNSKTNSSSGTTQGKTLQMELLGGNEVLASSNEAELGTLWMDSLGPFSSWATVGFGERALVPIVSFLPSVLRDQCMEALKWYFLDKLDCRRTDLGGKFDGGVAFDLPPAGKIKRINEIKITHGQNVDRLTFTYEMYGPGGRLVTETSKEFGYANGEFSDLITMRPDEEIISIEVGLDDDSRDGTMRQVAFRTNRRRFPGDTDFYGYHKSKAFRTISAPRVRCLFGRSGKLIEGLGLSYLGLADDTESREFLLAMEPYLFPDRDYGPIG